TQPYRYAYYLVWQGRYREAEQIFEQLAKTGSSRDRAWAYAGWSHLRWSVIDIQGAMEKANLAIASDRDLPVSYSLRAQAEQVLGHSEAALRDDRTHAKILPNFAQRYYEPESLGWALPLARASVDRLLGDFRAATAENVGVVATRGLPGDRIGEAS